MTTIVKELIENRTYKIDAQNQRTYTRSWRVEYTTKNVIAHDAVDEVGVLIGDDYGILSKCIDISSEPESDGYSFIVSATFGKWENDQPTSNPLSEPADIQWSFSQFSRVVDYDIYNNAILNSAGDPFQSIEIDDSRPVLTVSKNEAAFLPLLAAQYKDAINGTPFLGAPVNTVKVASISSQRQRDQIYGFYWKTSYVFDFNLETWTKKILDQGLRAIQGGTVRPIKDEAGGHVSSPVLLDGAGGKLPSGGTPVFLSKDVYKVLPFNIFRF